MVVPGKGGFAQFPVRAIERLSVRPSLFPSEFFQPPHPLTADSTLTTATPSVSKACSFSDFTATALSQIASVNACPTAVGDITVQGDNFATIDLTGVRQIFGDLSIQNSTVESIVAPDLQLVSGDFSISRATHLSTLNLAQLVTVGLLNFNALPSLESLGLTSGITSAESVVISNTGLTSLDGIDVFKLTTFDVNNNDAIASIDSSLQEVTDLLSISYNSEQVEVVLDELTQAKNIVFESIASVSMQNLTEVSGSLSLEANAVEDFEFPQLTSVGSAVSIIQNDELTEFKFPQLTSVGGALVIEDNEKLRSFSYFPKLKTIGGSVVISGDFNNGTFPALTRVSGGFNLTTTGDLTCSDFTQLNSDGDIKGDKFYCKAGSSTISSSSSKAGNSDGESTETGSDSSSSSSSSKTSGASAGAPAGKIASFIAAVAGFALVM